MLIAVPALASAQTYSFPSGFSTVQGQNQWRYQYGPGGSFIDMTWDAANSRWKGNEEYVLIGNWGTHPGSAADAVLTWTAPGSGSVHVTGNVSDGSPSCGDGVAPSVLLNASSLWQGTVNNGDATGVSFDLTQNVASGDAVRFVTNKRSENTCDSTYWTATVAYSGGVTANGALDSVGAVPSGWAIFNENQTQTVTVRLYLDHAYDQGGTLLGSAQANFPRPDLNAAGYAGDHGFNFAIPDQYQDGATHAVYAYAVKPDGTLFNLLGSPKNGLLPCSPSRCPVSLPVGSNDGHIKIETVGSIQTVYNYVANKCEDRDVPDTAVHAFRSADGTVNLTGNSLEGNYRNTGPTLDTVTHSCAATYRSAGDETFFNFKYHEWLFSPYTLDGTNVYALAHNEWYPKLANPSCSGTNGVIGAVTLLISNDGGATYAHPANYKVGVPTKPWVSGDSCSAWYGDWNTSNIIAKSGYYYVLFSRVGGPPYDSTTTGTCAMRSQNLADASSWRVWTGTDWQPMSSTPVCAFLPGLSWNMAVESVVYSTYLNKYVALSIDNTHPAEYSTSFDLLNWTTPVTIITPTELSNGDGVHISQGNLWYGSLLDPTDTSRNFENIGQEPYLYFGLYKYPSNDIIRQKIRFTNLDPAPVACTFNNQSVPNGQSVTAYQSSSVPFGQQCVSQQRSCSNGTLSGSYTNPSCSVTAAQSCTLNGSTVAHGAAQTFYSSQSVVSGSLCSSVAQSRICTNGTLSGNTSYQYSFCSVGQPQSCAFNNQTLANGATVTAYQSSSVPAGSQCVSQQRTCQNGTLSGSNQYASCTVGTANVCTPNWSCTGWNQCPVSGSQSRTCTDTNVCGVSTGKPGENQSCAYSGTDKPFATSTSTTTTPVATDQTIVQRVAALLVQIQQLQALLAKLKGGSTVVPTPPQTKATVTYNGKCPVLSRMLSRGMRGDDVTALQKFFMTQYKDYTTKYVTGLFGPTTEAALKQWQSEHGIERTGMLGPKTRAAITQCK